MPREESRYPDDWLRIAEKDLARTERSLDDGDPELAGCCLQQAIEKFLKAFLLTKGWGFAAFMTWRRFWTMLSCTNPRLSNFASPARRSPSITRSSAIP
jgi:hypothetical protein